MIIHVKSVVFAMEEQKKPDGKTVSDVLQSVSIAIDSYDDIFSDFDPSPYATRLLSEDFLRELKRHYVENRHGEFIITFTLPKSARTEKTETLVRKRIKDYFSLHLQKLKKDMDKSSRSGLIRVVGGILFDILLFAIPALQSPVIVTILSTLSLYLLWSGYENLFEIPSKFKSKQRFFEKFVSAKYNFVDEEEVVKIINIGSSYR